MLSEVHSTRENSYLTLGTWAKSVTSEFRGSYAETIDIALSFLNVVAARVHPNILIYCHNLSYVHLDIFPVSLFIYVL